MSTTVVFDNDGKCKFVLNGDAGSADLTEAAAFVQVEHAVDPNDVWYDFETSRMMYRTAMRVQVMKNKIERVPVGTKVYIGSESTTVDSGLIELEVDYPDTVRVVLTHVRYKDAVVEVPCEVQG